MAWSKANQLRSNRLGAVPILGLTSNRAAAKEEGGWALLGLILTLTIIAIALTGIAPSIQMEVRRDKEEEMIFRGQQMAEAIARYYNAGRLGPINVGVPPPYGYLTDLGKLRDGVTLGVTEFKFCRPSALIDPLDEKEWAPVRARDPRLMPALQAYAAANLTTIPPVYMLLAAAPTRTHSINSSNFGQGTGDQGASGFGGTGGQGGFGATQPGFGQGSISPGQGFNQPGQVGQGTPGGQPGAGQRPRATQADDDDDDDDDDTNVVDPLAGMLKGDPSNIPIVGVAPNLKGASVHTLWGLNRYQDWVFIYVPPAQFQNGIPQSGQPIQPIRPGQVGPGAPNQPLRISP